MSANALRRHYERVGSPYRYLTDPQQVAASVPFALTCWWGANGVGKSLGIAEATRRALACEHPWMEPGPHGIGVTGNTWQQLGSTLKYLEKMWDRAWFRPGIRFESGQLKGQRLQVFDIISGPCAGGELRCGTFSAGAANLAGPRLKFLAADEPLPEAIWNELWARLLGRDGRCLIGFTPTLGTSHKLDYMWELIDDKSKPWAGEIQTTLTLDACTPRGRVVAGSPLELPWVTQAELDRFTEGLSQVERAMRTGESRTPRRDSVYFDRWASHLVGATEPPIGATLGVGIDHGSKPGAQRAVLVAFAERGLYSRVWVLDEYQGNGRTESEEDARGLLDMLARNGVALGDVDRWIGDRAHRGDKRGGRKSNWRLRRAIAHATGINTRRNDWHDKLPRALRDMATPRKYDGSVWDGCEILHRLMVGEDPRLLVSPRCESLIEDLECWEGAALDPHKDGIDAFRYIVVPLVEGERR